MRCIPLLALIAALGCGAASDAPGPSASDPAGSYRLTAVNLSNLPVLISIQPFPFVKTQWRSGTLLLQDGHWTEQLVIEQLGSDTTLSTRDLAGTYATVADHLEFTVVTGGGTSLDSVQVVQPSGDRLTVNAGTAAVFTFVRQ